MEIVNTISNELVEAAFKRIRESEELGAGSCSVVDEATTDEELREEIVEELKANPIATVEDLFNAILETENIIQNVSRDIQGA